MASEEVEGDNHHQFYPNCLPENELYVLWLLAWEEEVEEVIYVGSEG